MSDDKLRLFHEEIMQEEGVKMSDLPIELQKKIKGFNLLKSSHEKDPQERTLINLRKRAIKLGDEIQDFIENDYEEDEEEDDDKKSSKNDDKDDKDDEKEKNPKSDKSDKTNDSNKKDKNPSKEKPVSTGGKFGNLMMEKKILAIMESKGDKRIKISDLEAIIGREPEYPEQIVNNIKLRKVFLSSDYRLV